MTNNVSEQKWYRQMGPLENPTKYLVKKLC